MSPIRTPALAALAAAGLTAASAGAEPVTLTTTDFQRRAADVRALGADGLTLADGTTLPLAEVLRIETDPPPAAGDAGDAGDAGGVGGGWRLRTRGGAAYLGTPAGIDGETMTFAADRVGDVAVPLTDVRSLAPAAAGEVPAAGGGDADVLTLANGDVIRGLLSDVTPDTLTIDRDGEAVTADLADVAALAVAPLGTPTRAPGWLVGLDGGTIARAEALALGDRLTMTVQGRELELPRDALAFAEQVDGPVVFLSGLAFEEEQVPYLSAAAPARVGGDVAGGPIAADGRPTDRGIGVHSASALTFDLPDGYERFVARYALADGAGGGNVDVRVLLDGEPAHAAEDVTAGTVGAVDVPLGGAEELTLEVGYGRNLDVQDRLNWIDPALVR